MNLPRKTIAQRFDASASGYNQKALVQSEIAQCLVNWSTLGPSATALDIGSGTGLVAQAISYRWPKCEVTALDAAPAMLRQAQKKMPELKAITGDAAHIDTGDRFDAIFSSMLLHWLPEPQKIIQRWQKWLKPHGRLHIAVLVDGSFREWRSLCSKAGLKDGLWPMPCVDFANGLAIRTEKRTHVASYASASEFLQQLKAIGASMPCHGHMPLSADKMRGVLSLSPKPFPVSYETLYIELPSSPSI